MYEATLQRQVIRAIRAEYPRAWVYKASDRFRSGVPDILICLRGVFCAIELKINSKVTKLQEYELAKIEAAGGRCGVCRSVRDVLCLLADISGEEVT